MRKNNLKRLQSVSDFQDLKILTPSLWFTENFNANFFTLEMKPEMKRGSQINLSGSIKGSVEAVSYFTHTVPCPPTINDRCS